MGKYGYKFTKKSTYEKHFKKLDSLINQHKITVLTPSEAI